MPVLSSKTILLRKAGLYTKLGMVSSFPTAKIFINGDRSSASFRCYTHGLRNEMYLISDLAGVRPSLLSCFHKAEVFIIPSQTKARELNEPVKPLQSKVHLVAQPVGYTKISG